MDTIDHAAKMAQQDPAFPDYDERGWPVPLVNAVSELREHAARVREIACELYYTNAIRSRQLQQIATSLEHSAAPADRYMDDTTGPGLCAPCGCAGAVSADGAHRAATAAPRAPAGAPGAVSACGAHRSRDSLGARVQWERRQACGDGTGRLVWREWKPCTEAEARRVTGLRTWEVMRIEYPTPPTEEPTIQPILVKRLVDLVERLPVFVREDHACAQCMPGGHMVVDGFCCAYHEARQLLVDVRVGTGTIHRG